MDIERYRKDLEETADQKPTRLEKRLARVSLAGHAAQRKFDNLDLSSRPRSWIEMILQALWSTVVTVVVLLGMAAALLPTLLWLGITMIPPLLLLGCLRQF